MKFKLIIVMVCLVILFGNYSVGQTDTKNESELVCLKFVFGSNNQAKIWDGTLTFAENAENCSFMYENSNKAWRDKYAKVQLTHSKVTWRGKATRNKTYTWAIYNNKRTDGYTPEKDFEPFKPFRLFVNMQIPEGKKLNVETVQGNFTFNPHKINCGDVQNFLDQQVMVTRVFPARKITDMSYIHTRYKYHGFPAVASTSTGKTYIAYSTYYEGMSPYRWHQFTDDMPERFDYLAQKSDGDRLNVLIEENGSITGQIPITQKGKDIFDISAVCDSENNIWIAWSERVNNNQDIYCTKISGAKAGEIKRITSDQGPDIHPALAANKQGVWLTWQGYRNGNFDILYSNIAQQKITENNVGHSTANEWAPTIATDSKGNIAIAWDTYKKGDYDVYYALLDQSGTIQTESHVAASLKFEARPSVIFDKDDRFWVAYELAGEYWGKDNGAHYFINPKVPTEGLYERRSIRVVCIDDGIFYTAKTPVHQIIPKETKYTFFYNSGAKPERYNIAQTPNHYLSHPVLAKDDKNRLCLVYKKNPDLKKGLSGTTQWWSFFTTFDGKQWSVPTLLYGSFSQMHEKPAITAVTGQGLKVIHAADRQKNCLSDDPDQFSQNLWLSYPQIERPDSKYELQKIATPELAEKSEWAIDEETDLNVIQNYRTTTNGKTYRIVKGDTHRHSAFSGDGGGDSEVEDTHRYALDVAALDWLNNGDHDNGYNEYYWNLTQKYTDIFHIDKKHAPLFGYERSCGFPDGHRNVIFTQRGIRMLPRVKYNKATADYASPDTRLLYRYLKQFDGICVSHTSATKTAGTDWRELNTDPEPVIEIYQGERMSAECRTCPRFDATIPYHPVNEKGFYRTALQQGHHLGIISSSDHRSTHISFAMVYVEEITREGIMDGLKKRRTYGATDNIVLDVKMNDHFMGDVIKSDTREINIHVIGTDKIKEIVVVKNDKEYEVKHKGKKEVEVSWTDDDVTDQESYYYVRIIQEDGELAWSSPIWATK